MQFEGLGIFHVTYFEFHITYMSDYVFMQGGGPAHTAKWLGNDAKTIYKNSGREPTGRVTRQT